MENIGWAGTLKPANHIINISNLSDVLFKRLYTLTSNYDGTWLCARLPARSLHRLRLSCTAFADSQRKKRSMHKINECKNNNSNPEPIAVK